MLLSHAIILGVIQGLGEFLPISSSGHLILLPWVMNFKDPGLIFSVALHLGTLFSLLCYFYKDWYRLFSAFFKSLTKHPRSYGENEKLIWFLLLGTIPGAIGGLLLEDYAETLFRNPLLVAIQLAAAGILLAGIDKVSSQKRPLSEMSLLDGLLIGFAQTLALIPGTSRSGITITMARFLKFDRVTSAKFSFLLSTPIVAGASVLKLKDVSASQIDFASLIAVLVSFVVGLLSIKYLLHFMQRYSYSIFAWYRLVIAALIVVGLYLKGSF